MKRSLINKLITPISIFCAVLLTLMSSCEKKQDDGAMSITNVSHTGCKNNEKNGLDSKSYNESTLKLRAIKGGNMRVIHENAIHNCCAGTITANCQLRNDTIFVTEESSNNDCDCLCPYDLEYVINHLEEKEYVIRVGTYEPITFKFNNDLDMTYNLDFIVE